MKSRNRWWKGWKDKLLVAIFSIDHENLLNNRFVQSLRNISPKPLFDLYLILCHFWHLVHNFPIFPMMNSSNLDRFFWKDPFTFRFPKFLCFFSKRRIAWDKGSVGEFRSFDGDDEIDVGVDCCWILVNDGMASFPTSILIRWIDFSLRNRNNESRWRFERNRNEWKRIERSNSTILSIIFIISHSFIYLTTMSFVFCWKKWIRREKSRIRDGIFNGEKFIFQSLCDNEIFSSRKRFD